MKRIVLLVAVIATFAISASAQCDKKVLWSAVKADFVDETGAVQDTKNVKVAIYTSKKEINITHDDDLTDSLGGIIKEFSCEWKQPFKNGKTIIKADLHDKDGEYTNSVITIEAADAKISVTINMVAPDGRKMIIKIPVDSYTEEKK
jgi:hypothetical protein